MRLLSQSMVGFYRDKLAAGFVRLNLLEAGRANL